VDNAAGVALGGGNCEVTDAAQETIPGSRPSALLEELLQALETPQPGDAVASFCARHRLAPPKFGGAWKLYFGDSSTQGAVLHLGTGFGDEFLAVRGADRRATRRDVALLSSRTHATIVRRRLQMAGIDQVALAVCRDPARLPLADASIATAIVGHAELACFGLQPERNAEPERPIAAELRRVLAPGGKVLLGLNSSALGRLLARSAQLVRRRATPAESLDSLIRGALATETAPSGRQMLRALRAIGFEEVRCIAPLPSSDRPRVALRLDEPELVQYVLSRLLRRNTLSARVGRLAAATLARAGLLRWILADLVVELRLADEA